VRSLAPARADIIIASLQNADNLAALKLKGWTDAETTAFVTARKSFGTGDETKQGAKGGGKDSITVKNTDAADLYERLAMEILSPRRGFWPASAQSASFAAVCHK
jgi:hypothetical protein